MRGVLRTSTAPSAPSPITTAATTSQTQRAATVVAVVLCRGGGRDRVAAVGACVCWAAVSSTLGAGVSDDSAPIQCTTFPFA